MTDKQRQIPTVALEVILEELDRIPWDRVDLEGSDKEVKRKVLSVFAAHTSSRGPYALSEYMVYTLEQIVEAFAAHGNPIKIDAVRKRISNAGIKGRTERGTGKKKFYNGRDVRLLVIGKKYDVEERNLLDLSGDIIQTTEQLQHLKNENRAKRNLQSEIVKNEQLKSGDVT